MLKSTAFLVLCVTALMTSAVMAAIPQVISYQGLLKTAGGTPAADSSYLMKFVIYGDSTGSVELWNSGFQPVTTTDGLFTVGLGASPMPSLPDDIFSDTARYLGITVGGDAEMAPLTRLMATPFVYHALRADTASSVAWSAVSARPVVLADLGCSDGQVPQYNQGGGFWECVDADAHAHGGTFGWIDDGTIVRLDDSNDSVGIGTTAPDAPLHIAGNASSALPAVGFHTEWSNAGSGGGIAANIEYAHGNTSGLSAGMTVSSTANSSDTAYGIGASANNDGSGPAKAGYFSTGSGGTGHKYGVEALALNNSLSEARGVYGIAENTGTGSATGGYFHARTGGTGSKWGVVAVADGNTNNTVNGLRSTAWNYGTGGSVAASFDATQGPGVNTGVDADVTTIGSSTATMYTGTSTSDAGTVYGYDGSFSSNSGDVYGFNASLNSTTGAVYGTNITATSNSEIAYGGFFTGTSVSSTAVGVSMGANGSGPSSIMGASVSAAQTGIGQVFGVRSVINPWSSGEAYSGYFAINNRVGATGTKYGVYATADGNQSSLVYGVYGTASNSGSGNAMGVYGTASTIGSGNHFGVWGSEQVGGGGAAVYAAGDQIASGTKSAVMRTSQGERLMYAVEATEVWFEDIGRAQLSGGHAHVELDPLFLETVGISAANPLHVFIQLNGDCTGTYVVTGATGFDVHEIQNGTSDVAFSYRAMAKRRGYAEERMRKTEAGLYDVNLYPERKDEIEAYWQRQRSEEDPSSKPQP